jgi:hypothetical protein
MPFNQPIEFNEIRGFNSGISSNDNDENTNWINLVVAIIFWALGVISLVSILLGNYYQWVIALICTVFGTIHFLIYKRVIKQ